MDNDDDEGDQVRVLSSNSRHGGLRPPLSPVAGKRQSSPFSKSKTQKTGFSLQLNS